MKAHQLKELLQKEKVLDVLTISYNSSNAIFVNVRLKDKRYKINIDKVKSTDDFYLECLKCIGALKVLSDGAYVIEEYIIDDDGNVLNFKFPHLLLSSEKAKEFLECNNYTINNLLIHAPVSVKPKFLDNTFYLVFSLNPQDFVLSEALMFEMLYSYII